MSDNPTTLDAAALRRYNRQILLKEFGVAGQLKLSQAKVLIVGAGGLGSPAALYLAAAGVGTIGIADLDHVEEHNLQRQLLHPTQNIGQPKVDSAIASLRAINPLISLVPHREGVTSANAITIFRQYDIILDGTDNFPVRYLNNDAAFFAQRPLVHGSIYKFEGQISVFDTRQGGPCYRCLFPEPPSSGTVPNCGEAGVVGALCGVIGSMQALEVIKYITGYGELHQGKLLTYRALDHQTSSIIVPRSPECPLCGTKPIITQIEPERYRPVCETISSTSMKESEYPFEITVQAAHEILNRNLDDTILIDVREPHELAICRIETAQHIPMRQVPENLTELPKDKHLLILCHHGGRSRRVTEYLRSQGLDKVTNINGGIDGWAREIDQELTRY